MKKVSLRRRTLLAIREARPNFDRVVHFLRVRFKTIIHGGADATRSSNDVSKFPSSSVRPMTEDRSVVRLLNFLKFVLVSGDRGVAKKKRNSMNSSGRKVKYPPSSRYARKKRAATRKTYCDPWYFPVYKKNLQGEKERAFDRKRIRAS